MAIFISSCDVFHHVITDPYEAAFRFVVNDLMTSSRHVAVSDSLDEFDIFMAKSLLRGKYDSLTINNSTCQIQTDFWVKHKISKSKKGTPSHYLIFSRIHDRMMTAEIIDYQHFIKYGNDRFTTVRLYYFIFDEKMRIKESIVTNAIND